LDYQSCLSKAKGTRFPNLKGITYSTIITILNKSNIKPHKIRYYLEKQDPDFDQKMNEVLIVYKQLKLNFKLMNHQKKFSSHMMRNQESKQTGMLLMIYYQQENIVSSLAGMNLYTGDIISLVSDTHKRSDFMTFLKLLDEKYNNDVKIKVILDNHSAHTSNKTCRYLESQFVFAFTPKHGS